MAREGKINLQEDLPAATKEMIAEGANPLEMLIFLKQFIGKSIKDLEEKANENRNPDSTD